MGVLTRIGELIKVFSSPQQEMQDEEISIDRLEKIARQSGMTDKEISELSKNYQKIDKGANDFEKRMKESAKAKKADEEKNSIIKPQEKSQEEIVSERNSGEAR